MSNLIVVKDSVINLDRMDYVAVEQDDEGSWLSVAFSGGGVSRMHCYDIEEARKLMVRFVQDYPEILVGTKIGGLVLTQLADNEDGESVYRWVREEHVDKLTEKYGQHESI